MNDTRSIHVQIQSFGNYLQDMWIIALVLVVFQHETTMSLPFVWIALQIVITILLQVIYSKTGPNIFIAFIVPAVILFLLFSVDASFLFYIILLALSSWRAYVRYNTVQNEVELDSGFSLLLFATFLCVYFFLFFMRYENYSVPLFILLVSGVLLFVGIRMFTIRMSSIKSSMLKLFSGYVAGVFALFSLSWIVYIVIDDIRELFDVLIEVVVGVLIIPFGPLIEYLMAVVNGLSIQQLELGDRVPVGQSSEIEQRDTISEGAAVNFPFEWLVFALIAVVLIVLIVLIMKRKRENFQVELSNIQYEHEAIFTAEKEKNQPETSFYEVETSLLREQYIQFEQEAKTVGYERAKSETVREWFGKMGWSVDEQFFRIYETVRYGGQSIESSKAELFIQTLEMTKTDYFIKKDV